MSCDYRSIHCVKVNVRLVPYVPVLEIIQYTPTVGLFTLFYLNALQGTGDLATALLLGWSNVRHFGSIFGY